MEHTRGSDNDYALMWPGLRIALLIVMTDAIVISADKRLMRCLDR